MDTWSSHPYVLVEHPIPTPWALIFSLLLAALADSTLLGSLPLDFRAIPLSPRFISEGRAMLFY